MLMVKKLGEILIDSGLIDTTQLEAALGRQKTWGGSSDTRSSRWAS